MGHGLEGVGRVERFEEAVRLPSAPGAGEGNLAPITIQHATEKSSSTPITALTGNDACKRSCTRSSLESPLFAGRGLGSSLQRSRKDVVRLQRACHRLHGFSLRASWPHHARPFRGCQF